MKGKLSFEPQDSYERQQFKELTAIVRELGIAYSNGAAHPKIEDNAIKFNVTLNAFEERSPDSTMWRLTPAPKNASIMYNLENVVFSKTPNYEQAGIGLVDRSGIDVVVLRKGITHRIDFQYKHDTRQ